MRVLIDTNVIVSALVFGGVPEGVVERAMRGAIELVTSREQLDELRETLVGKFGFEDELAVEACRTIESVARVVEPTRIPRVCRDPSDDHIVAAALEGDAELIVTGDRDLLELDPHEGIRIVSPAVFDRP